MKHPNDTVVVNAKTMEFDVLIDRTGPFGNPFKVGRDGDRVEVLGKYREYLLRRVECDTEFKTALLTLRGKRLGCHCAPDRLCHGMIIVEWLERAT